MDPIQHADVKDTILYSIFWGGERRLGNPWEPERRKAANDVRKTHGNRASLKSRRSTAKITSYYSLNRAFEREGRNKREISSTVVVRVAVINHGGKSPLSLTL